MHPEGLDLAVTPCDAYVVSATIAVEIPVKAVMADDHEFGLSA